MPSPETAGFADIFFGIYALVCKSVVCSNKAKAHLSANTPLRTLTALSIVWDSSLESGAESRKIDKKIFRKVACGPELEETLYLSDPFLPLRMISAYIPALGRGRRSCVLGSSSIRPEAQMPAFIPLEVIGQAPMEIAAKIGAGAKQDFHLLNTGM
jgi:hypothetical protein